MSKAGAVIVEDFGLTVSIRVIVGDKKRSKNENSKRKTKQMGENNKKKEKPFFLQILETPLRSDTSERIWPSM